MITDWTVSAGNIAFPSQGENFDTGGRGQLFSNGIADIH